MARSISFNGQTLFRPGAISRVNASALSPIGVTAVGIVGLIGEADGGEPGLHTIDDPVLAKALFRSGPLADAVRLAFEPSNDPRIPAGAFRVYAYKVNQSTQGTLQVPGDGTQVADTAAMGSTTTVINLTTGGLTVDAHIGRWLKIGSENRRIVDNAATTITVSPGFTAAPAAMTAVTILQSQIVLTSEDYGAHASQISFEFEAGATSGTYVVTLALEDTVETSPELGGDAFLRLMYNGGAVETNGTGPVTAATTTTITVNTAAAPTLNQFANMILEIPALGLRRLIASNTAADPTVITLDAAHAITTAQATAAVGLTANVRNVTAATATITGANGLATGVTSTVSPVSDNLSITFSNNQTLRSFVDQINSTTNYVATVPDGVNQDTTLMETFDFGTRATAVDVRFDSAISPTTKGSFLRDLQVVVDWINNFSELVTAVKATAGTSEGSELPLVTGGVYSTTQDVVLYLTGGTRGISANSNWQDGFDAMMEKRMNHIVPLISYDLTNDGYGSTATFASVAAQLSAHVSEAQGVGKNEQGGYIGMDGTKDDLLDQAKALNNTDAQLVGQKVTVLDVDGNLVEQPEWAAAVIAAGMRSGASDIGEPLTFKSPKIAGFSQDASWSPSNITDANELIQGGVMFLEQTPSGVFRWVRDLTTYLKSDNIAFIDGNIREEVRVLVYDLRTSLEDRFTGIKAVPATVASIREFVAAKMAVYREQTLITPSFDEQGVFCAEGFRKLRVFVTGNVATIRCEIFPTAGIVFEIVDINLQLARLAV